MRHTHVNVSCRVYHTQVEIVLLGDVFQVKRVERNAVSANAGTGIKRLKAEGLGFGGFNYFPDINMHLPGE